MTTVTDFEHQAMVATLAKDGEKILKSLTPKKCDAWHHATGVCTEAGELLDAVKKYVIYNKAIDRDNVIEELGDIEFYLTGIRQNLGITRVETLAANMAKLAKRYPNFQYTDMRAHERADKADNTVVVDGLLWERQNNFGLLKRGELYGREDCPYKYCSAVQPKETCGHRCHVAPVERADKA